jgi:hypothetical protein
MAVPVKQPIPINFAQGLDTKSDPKQIPIGKFFDLQNSIFTKAGLLQKRNGFGSFTPLPTTGHSYLTTFNGNLTAIGDNLAAYNEGSAAWVQKGSIQPVSLDTLPLVRNNLNQAQADSAVSSNNLLCTAYVENNGTASVVKYTIADYLTGQAIISPMPIPVSTGVPTGGARVFVLPNYFVIIFTNLIGGGTSTLQYICISIANPNIVTTAQNIAPGYGATTGLSWDAVVVGNAIYIAYNTASGGQAIKTTVLTSANASGGISPPVSNTYVGRKATVMSVTADITNPANPIIWASFYDSASSTGYVLAFNQILGTVLAPTEIITSGTILNITAVAQNAAIQVYYEVSNTYSYDTGIHTNYIATISCTQSGAVGTAYDVIRSVGLASKAFIVNGVTYFLSAYNSAYQAAYYLINASVSTQALPVVVAKLAYQNGGGYLTMGLPSALVSGSEVQIAYLYKDLIASVNKGTNLTSGTQVNGIYSQTGVNLVTFDLSTNDLDSAEIGNNLNLSGGFLWMYDGVKPVENNFFVYPDNVEVTTSTTGGSLAAQQYFYQVTYEWTDNQGNAFRSAPSIPVSVTTTGSTSANTVNVPYLRLTYKVASPVKIVVYRWSTAQEIYYQVTSINQPVLNETTSDSVAIVDTLSDATILGNNIIYTNGGVVEDVSGPSSNLLTLFDDRLWLVDSEDKNLLWYSKQVIEGTPVEMSDLFTIYVAPSTAAQGSTGVITAIAPLDDKLVIFKNNAIYYINGSGPDNTGASSQYSQPIFITSTVGCMNQKSIVFTPSGLMFQSDKGIWLLGRDMSTNYIGAPVENYTMVSNVLSALNVPATNQVRFTMDSGVTLMYDYYYQQWGTFTGIPGVSATLYQSLHTYINKYGQAFQETPDLYIDGADPTLMSFTTGWINPAGLQGYIRSYYFFLLGQYISPHKLLLKIAYDYNSSPEQTTLISPTNFNPTYGLPSPYGQGSPYGGQGATEDWRVFLAKQRCQAFQITLNEVYDSSFGVAAGAGLTLSGLNLIIGVKQGWRVNSSAHSAGGSIG